MANGTRKGVLAASGKGRESPQKKIADACHIHAVSTSLVPRHWLWSGVFCGETWGIALSTWDELVRLRLIPCKSAASTTLLVWKAVKLRKSISPGLPECGGNIAKST